jgi:sec-independent protein translocase protein TatB
LFDVSFSELLIIAIVALIVIGPEKLPKVARTLGLLTGRLQRYVSTVKADIDRELHLEDMRKLEQDARHSIMATHSEITTELGKVETEVSSSLDAVAPDKPSTPA